MRALPRGRPYFFLGGFAGSLVTAFFAGDFFAAVLRGADALVAGCLGGDLVAAWPLQALPEIWLPIS